MKTYTFKYNSKSINILIKIEAKNKREAENKLIERLTNILQLSDFQLTEN